MVRGADGCSGTVVSEAAGGAVDTHGVTCGGGTFVFTTGGGGPVI